MAVNPHALVLEILQRAVSQDTILLKSAEERLLELEKEPGFYGILRDIFCDASIDVNLRLLAVVYFKNGVDKYWRHNAPNAMSDNDRNSVRQSLPVILNEPVKIIANHFAVLIARISRFDCPHHWPELVPTLLNAIKNNGSVEQLRALIILNQVVKTLASKRLTGDRRMFQELTSFLYSTICETWEKQYQIFIEIVKTNEIGSVDSLERAILLLKILQKLTIRGSQIPYQNNSLDLFMKSLIEKTKYMLQLRISMSPIVEELVKKYIVRSVTVLQSLLEIHPSSFAEYVQVSLEFAVFFAFTSEGEPYLFDRFLLECLNLIKAVIICMEYKLRRSYKKQCDLYDSEKKQYAKAYEAKVAFFNDITLVTICRKLVSQYFLLNQSEIELWASDPESYASEECGETWKYSLRASKESLFEAMMKEYATRLAPVMVELIQLTRNIVSPQDTQALLLKDAVYNAVGIASFHLYDEVDFDTWFTTTLVKEMEITDGNYRIIRRRAAWLTSRWTHVKMSNTLHPVVYDSMLFLLRPDEDIVVRLTAAKTIAAVLDAFECETELFVQYLEKVVNALFTLLKDAQEYDTKMNVLHVISSVVERVGFHIEPYHLALVQYLPFLWKESESHNMLRCAVVSSLAFFVKGVEAMTKCPDTMNFLISVISNCTDSNHQSYVYLVEDGLELWEAVMENTTAPTPDLMRLFGNIVNLFEQNADQLKKCVQITSSYLLLAPEQTLEIYGSKLVEKFIDVMSDLKAEGILLLLNVIELMIKVSGTLACNILNPIFPSIFEIILNYEDSSFRLMPHCLSILARVLLESQEIFIEVIKKLSILHNQNQDDVLNKIIDVWLERMPEVAKLKTKKLLGLALSSLLCTNPNFVYNKFCGILLAVSEVLNDITVTVDGAVVDCSYQDERNFGLCENEEELRKKNLSMKDPVRNTDLKEYFTSQINKLRIMLGPEQFENFLQTVDVETLAQTRVFVPL